MGGILRQPHHQCEPLTTDHGADTVHVASVCCIHDLRVLIIPECTAPMNEYNARESRQYSRVEGGIEESSI